MPAICRVTHSTLGACLGAQAYMCFYVKRHLDYKPWSTPSYVKAREAEAVKERAREREKEAKEAARMREFDDEILATVL
jgi:ubiquitin carboxyl-terminal hydrolase 22/27/51